MPIPLIGPQLVEGVSEMLWRFGFRHHPELQTQWIEGTAGLATIAKIADKKPETDHFDEMAEEFLSVNDPQLLEAIRKAPKDQKKVILQKLEKNFQDLSVLIEMLKDDE